MIDDNVRSDWTSRAAIQIVRWRFLFALLGLIILGISFPISQRLEFDRRIESLFATDDPDLLAYAELKEAFGGNAVVLLVYQDHDLTSQSGIGRNRDITTEIKGLEGVTDVLSTSRLNDAIQRFRPGLSLSLTPVNSADSSTTPNLFRPDDPVAKGFDEIFAGYTHSRDHNRAAVVALLAPDHPAETIERLKLIAADLPSRFASTLTSDAVIGNAVIVGEPVLVHDGLALIERDGARLATVTIALLSIVVVISLADFRFVILTALTIVWSVIVTRAVMVAIDVQLSLVSSVLTAIVTVVAVTAVLHLGIRFRSARWRGKPQERATIDSLQRLLKPIFWTCATDAAGFLALYVSRIAPIRQFGLMIAVAAAAVFIAIVLFSGTAMMLPGIGSGLASASRQHRFTRGIRRLCLAVASRSIANPNWSLVAAVVAGGLACLGLGRIETDTSFLNNFRSRSPIALAYREVETNFGGAGVWDIVLDAPQELTPVFLDQVRVLEDRLREIDIDGAGLTKVLSLADAEAVVARSRFASLLPPSSRLSAMYAALPGFFDALLSSPRGEFRKLRIMLRSREQLESDQKDRLIAEVERIVREHTSDERWVDAVGATRQGRVTGYHVLMARLVGQLVGDQWRCFAASSLLVLILLALATRSIRLAVAALIPNLLPIFVVLAVLGLLGGRINMGAAMIAAVSIGISIDGSVHLLLGYLRNRDHGHSVNRATAMAAGSIGVPVLLATTALILGFGVLATSEFVPTATFGLLVAVTLALGTLVNLTLLPAFVILVESRSGSVADDRPIM